MTGERLGIRTYLDIALVTVAAVAIWLGALAASRELGGEPLIGRGVFVVLVTLGAALIVIVRVRAQPPRNAAWLGLERGNWRIPPFVAGLSWYLVPAAAAFGLAAAFGAISVTALAPAGDVALTVLTLAVLVFMSEALPEELIFRGYLQSRLGDAAPVWAAIAGQAVLFTGFALAIGAVEDLLDASFLATFAVVLGLLRAASGSLWAPMGFHLACMTTQQTFSGAGQAAPLSDPQLAQMVLFAMIPFGLVIAALAARVSAVQRA